MTSRSLVRRRPMSLHGWAVLLGAALAAAACRSPRADAVLPACEPVAGPLPDDADAGALIGEYRLRLLSADPQRGAEGALTLRAMPDSLRFARTVEGRIDSTVVHPLYGTTDADLGAVGAMMAGDGTSSDPTHPGVLVVQWWSPAPGGTRSTDVVLRIGSEGNRLGATPFDAAYTVLRVGRINDSGFAGGWESGAAGQTMSGHFCADRRAP